jgi:hypothetical protein
VLGDVALLNRLRGDMAKICSREISEVCRSRINLSQREVSVICIIRAKEIIALSLKFIHREVHSPAPQIPEEDEELMKSLSLKIKQRLPTFN